MPMHVAHHPLVRHKLGILREVGINTAAFRALTREITSLLCYEAFSDLQLEQVTVQGWAGPVTVERLAGKKVAVVPILRAGVGMLQGVLDLVPSARVGVVGLYRNEETLEPVQYYCNLAKDGSDRLAVIIDPMLATGGSLLATIDLLKDGGCKEIRVVCMVAAPEGAKKLEARHPEIHVYTAAMDDRLNEVGYILPGLGDAGDRIFGTK